MTFCKAKLKTGPNAGNLCANKALLYSKFCGIHTKPPKSPLPLDFNNFFDQIYIVNLEDKKRAYDEVSVQLQKYGIKHSRFLAIDGRGDAKQKSEKRKLFEKIYKVKILPDKDGIYNMPATSLTIGNILMMREMVEKKWERMLILEDDVVLDKNIIDDFATGIREIDKSGVDWDLLYLSCGSECGRHGVTYNKTSENVNKSTWMEHYSWPDLGLKSVYVKEPFDIRFPCKRDDCPRVSKHISAIKSGSVGGTFAYAITYKGAIKFLKFVNSKIGGPNDKLAHIDQLLKTAINKKILKALAFDPIIIYHKDGVKIAGNNTITW
jgi:GR25 family glycosyltransferase involved in LPS biosynthesis